MLSDEIGSACIQSMAVFKNDEVVYHGYWYYPSAREMFMLFRTMAVVFLLLSQSGCIEFDNQDRNFVISQNFFDKNLPDNVALVRFGNIEGSGKYNYKWASGPEAIIVVATPWQRSLDLEYSVTSPFQNVGISFSVNGSIPVQHVINADDMDKPYCGRFRFFSEAGVNVVLVSFSNWNGKDVKLLNDDRPLAVRFHSLEILESKGK